MLFNKFFAGKPITPTEFTQMAWATSYHIGCGVGDCSGNTNVVCRYIAKGKIIGEYVYKLGEPCTACDYGCTLEGVLCHLPPTAGKHSLPKQPRKSTSEVLIHLTNTNNQELPTAAVERDISEHVFLRSSDCFLHNLFTLSSPFFTTSFANVDDSRSQRDDREK
ncbi:hypothetical protein Y032_0002g609 [Ancylostoma ceylanicum]|uniref:SCP domain-containing protein n=1 Tax=Ancylostoma ceylanicum TaxID=53326 RepID=A0A016W1I0_9BILA|nr:hypothetical protein Y032_0002g609 [Ancylostoma ceylanicum]